MHSCSITCDLETNRQHTCSCEYHMPPREGEGGREFICGQSDDISCSKNCGARVIQTLPTFSHMLSYPQVRAQSRNNSMPLVAGKLGKKPPAAHRIHCTGSICLLQAFAAVSKCLFKVMHIHPSKIRQDNVPGHKRTD